MGQSQLHGPLVADTVITNAVILDHWGIVKADIGIKDGRISAIGKAGNPDIQPGVTDRDRRRNRDHRRRRCIVTAGGVDSHIHFICPQQMRGSVDVRRHHDDRRRNRAGSGHQRDDVYTGTVEHRAHAARRPM